MNRSDQPITAPNDCLNEPGNIGVVPEGLSNFPDCDVNVFIGLYKNVVSPQPFLDFVSTDQFTLVFCKQNQKLKRQLLEPNPLLSKRQFVTSQVYLQLEKVCRRVDHGPKYKAEGRTN